MTPPARFLPPIDAGTAPAAAPASLPGGIHWRDLPGNVGVASGLQALSITERRGRTRRLRRMAERTARRMEARR